MTVPRKRIAVLFFDSWLPYSPTTLNLYDQLNEHFETVIFQSSKEHGATTIGAATTEDRNVEYLDDKPPAVTDKFNFLIHRIFARGAHLDYAAFVRIKRLKKALRNFRPDHVIAVDHAALLCASRAWAGKLHFLSLELSSNPEPTRALAEKLDSVLIESETRYKHLFNDAKDLRVFLLHNAPVFRPLVKPRTVPEDLVYCGTTVGRFGLYSCLRFLSHYPGYILTIKGQILKGFNDNALMLYQDLFDEDRVRLEPGYMSEDKLNAYLSGFRIGFCFYDLRYFHNRDFHYRHVQSGKMYRYFSCGVPVVANNLPGLAPVQDFGAGILIDNLTPEAIHKAIQAIEADYDKYVKNCFTAARHFDFKKHVAPVLDYFQTN